MWKNRLAPRSLSHKIFYLMSILVSDSEERRVSTTLEQDLPQRMAAHQWIGNGFDLPSIWTVPRQMEMARDGQDLMWRTCLAFLGVHSRRKTTLLREFPELEAVSLDPRLAVPLLSRSPWR